jgi:hypothetical protein
MNEEYIQATTEMNFLQTMIGVSRSYMLRNEDIGWRLQITNARYSSRSNYKELTVVRLCDKSRWNATASASPIVQHTRKK